MFPVYHHEHTFDDLMLLPNGSLAHRLVHKDNNDDKNSGHSWTDRILYAPDKYCVDDLVLETVSEADGEGGGNHTVVEFAYICVNNKVRF